MKLKEIDLRNFTFVKSIQSQGTLTNVKYDGEILTFQTPKILVHRVVMENNKKYLFLKLLPTQASEMFKSKISEIESRFSLHSNFNEDILKVKINDKTRLYTNTLVNMSLLKEGDIVICLVSFEKIWNNEFYYLVVKEIKVI
jgi:hypothetical protein